MLVRGSFSQKLLTILLERVPATEELSLVGCDVSLGKCFLTVIRIMVPSS
jgi:hypothetical protein